MNPEFRKETILFVKRDLLPENLQHIPFGEYYSEFKPKLNEDYSKSLTHDSLMNYYSTHKKENETFEDFSKYNYIAFELYLYDNVFLGGITRIIIE